MNRPQRDKSLRYWMVAAVAVALYVALIPMTAQAQGTPAPRIAVLPLENSSGDPAQDCIAGGLTDEFALALANVRGLSVIARSSSFQLKPADRESKAAGKALNATHLVRGNVRMVG